MISRAVHSSVASYHTASSSKLSNSNRNKSSNSNVRISNSSNIPLIPLSLLTLSTRTITPNTTLRFSSCKLRRGQLLEALNRESGLLSKTRILEAIIITRGGTKRKIVTRMTREWTKPNSALYRLLQTPFPPFSLFLLPSFSLIPPTPRWLDNSFQPAIIVDSTPHQMQSLYHSDVKPLVAYPLLFSTLSLLNLVSARHIAVSNPLLYDLSNESTILAVPTSTFSRNNSCLLSRPSTDDPRFRPFATYSLA